MCLLFVATLGFLALSGVCHAASSEPSSASSAATTPGTTTEIVVTTTQPVNPTSQPKPTGVSYVVTDVSGTVCILLNSTIKFSLPYKAVSGGFLVTDYYLPSGGSTSGSSCIATMADTTGQLLKVSNFYEDWTFHLFFERSGNSFAATKLLLDYKVTASPLFPNATSGEYRVKATFNGTFQSPLFASASIPGYLICNAESTTSLNSDLLNATGTKVAFKGLTVFAFGSQNSTALTGTKTQCSADAPAPDYLVPIIVGCALAGIILIVLIAYIIGRYRSRSTYQTV